METPPAISTVAAAAQATLFNFPIGGVRRGFAGRPVHTFDLDGPPVLSFEASHDLFDDGSLLLVDLAGHTPGQVGVLAHTQHGWALLAGDAAWRGDQIEALHQKSGFPGCLVDEDREMTWRTLHRLHRLVDPESTEAHVRVIPAHDHGRAAPWRPQP